MKRLFLFLLFAATAHGALTVTDRGTGTSNTNSTSIVVQPSGDMAIGSTGVLVIAMDNAGGATSNLSNTTSTTDSVGNVWYVRLNTTAGSANQISENAILTSVLTATFHTTDNLTVSLANTTLAKCWTLSEVVPASGKVAFVNTMTTLNQSAGNTASPSIATIYPCVGDVILAWGTAEWGGAGPPTDTWVGSTDTTNGSFSTMQHNGAGPASAAGMSVMSQYKVATGAATSTFNPTLTISDCKVGYVMLTETDPKARVNGNDNTAGTTTVVTFTSPIALGSAAVMCISADNGGTSGTTANLTSATITDSRGNTWTRQQDVIYNVSGVNTGVEVGIYTSIIGTAIQVNDTMTIAWTSSAGAKCWSVWEFAKAGTGTMSVVTSGAGTGATTASPTVTTGTIANNDYVIGLLGVEDTTTANDSIVGDTDTSNGTWSSQLVGNKGTGALGMAISSQFKQVTAAATQTYNPTISAGTPDTMTAWIEINDSSVLGPTAQQKAAFFFLFP